MAKAAIYIGALARTTRSKVQLALAPSQWIHLLAWEPFKIQVDSGTRYSPKWTGAIWDPLGLPWPSGVADSQIGPLQRHRFAFSPSSAVAATELHRGRPLKKKGPGSGPKCPVKGKASLFLVMGRPFQQTRKPQSSVTNRWPRDFIKVIPKVVG